MAARAAAVVIAEAEAVGGADGVVAGQVVHAGDVTFPGRHGRGGRGGGQGDADEEERQRENKVVFLFRCRENNCV